MDKVEKKRQKEQYVVEEMIRLYCRKKHPKEERQEGQMCPNVKDFRIMQNKEVKSVHLWKKRRFVRIVRCIVISRR